MVLCNILIVLGGVWYATDEVISFDGHVPHMHTHTHTQATFKKTSKMNLCKKRSERLYLHLSASRYCPSSFIPSPSLPHSPSPSPPPPPPPPRGRT